MTLKEILATMKLLLTSLFALLSIATNAAWTLDSPTSPTTLTDGNWQLSVSLKNKALP